MTSLSIPGPLPDPRKCYGVQENQNATNSGPIRDSTERTNWEAGAMATGLWTLRSPTRSHANDINPEQRGHFRAVGKKARGRKASQTICATRGFTKPKRCGCTYRTNFTVLAAAAHEMPHEGLQPDDLIGRFQGVAKGLVKRHVACTDGSMWNPKH